MSTLKVKWVKNVQEILDSAQRDGCMISSHKFLLGSNMKHGRYSHLRLIHQLPHQYKVSKFHPGATIVPIIFGSDKTLVMEHSGTKSAWLIYISIGNLDHQT